MTVQLHELQKIREVRLIIRRGEDKAATHVSPHFAQGVLRRADHCPLGIGSENEAGRGGVRHVIKSRRRFTPGGISSGTPFPPDRDTAHLT